MANARVVKRGSVKHAYFTVVDSDGRTHGVYTSRPDANRHAKAINAKAKKNPSKLKPGVWIKADKVRVVQRNGRKVVEVKRFVTKPRKRAATKRKRATAKRRR